MARRGREFSRTLVRVVGGIDHRFRLRRTPRGVRLERPGGRDYFSRQRDARTGILFQATRRNRILYRVSRVAVHRQESSRTPAGAEICNFYSPPVATPWYTLLPSTLSSRVHRARVHHRAVHAVRSTRHPAVQEQAVGLRISGSPYWLESRHESRRESRQGTSIILLLASLQTGQNPKIG